MGALFFGGLVKGTVGIGLPTATFVISANFVAPLTAIAANVLPMLITNALQASESRNWKEIAHRERYLLYGWVIGLISGAWLLPQISDVVLLLIVGAAVSLFCLVELMVRWPVSDPARIQQLGFPTGLLSGLLGGISTLWASPLLIYYTLRQLDKQAFIVTTGFILTIGGFIVLVSYLVNGVLAGERLYLSAAGCVPALAGFLIGKHIRSGLSQSTFRKVLLWVFLIAGLTIVARGLSLG